MPEESDLDPFGTKAPYWERHYGISHPWHPTERGRRGCLFMLYGGFVAIVLVLVIAAIAALVR